MLPFRTILFPVDYSAACRALIPHVKDAVQHFSARLTLVHAFGPEGLTFFDMPVEGAGLTIKVRHFEEQRLKEFAQEAFPGVQVDCFAELGEPGTVIQEVLERQGADLIMLSTHGRGPIRRMMLGSVAAKILHDANCAVWTTAHQIQAGEYRSIVCAVDETPESASIITAGAALAKSYGAKLAVVHVFSLPPVSVEMDYATVRAELWQASATRLRETLADLKIEAEHAVIEGGVAEALHEWMGKRGVDLLVTGRGRADDGLGRVWSSLYSIVRESPCPVLSI
jgi:nucleotide-binding universal stress UspA family protein